MLQKRLKAELQITGFNSNIDNMIKWADLGNYVYKVENINKVWSRGL